MSILEIRLFGDPVLRQRAQEITDFDPKLQKLATDMLETMRDAPGVGLAAPQVGVLKRLFTWGIDERNGAVANPVVTDTSEEVVEDDEGCLSFPGLFFPTARPLRVEVTWQDLAGDEQQTQLEGFDARVWLHEIDHLNGVLFIDHLAAHDRKAAMRAMRQYRLEQGVEGPETATSGNLLLGRRP